MDDAQDDPAVSDDLSSDTETVTDAVSGNRARAQAGTISADSMANRRLAVLVGVVLVVVDQATKFVVEQVLEPGVFVPWLSDAVGWQLVYNDGAAFGLPLPWWAFPLVATVVVVVVWRTLPTIQRRLPVIAYATLAGGAVGNLVDRFLRTGDIGDPRFLHGHVVDFVAWGSFPRFNVADVAINVGFALLAWDLLRHGDDSVASRDRDDTAIADTAAASTPQQSTPQQG